jgi:hypothetical protein
MQEKRRCLRFSVELPAWYKNTSDKNFTNAITLDISATGICFVNDDELEPGQELLMKVKLPPKEEIVINTKVIWVKGLFGSGAKEYRVGVKITEPVRFDESKFVKFCAKIMLDLFKPT